MPARRSDKLPTTMLKKGAGEAGATTLLGRLKTRSQSSEYYPLKEGLGNESLGLDVESVATTATEGGKVSLERKSSSVVKCSLAEEYHKQLFRLYLQEADQQDRLALVGNKFHDLQVEYEGTKSKIESTKESLKELEETTTACKNIKRQHIADAKAALEELRAERDVLRSTYERNLERIESRMSEWEEEVAALELEIIQIERQEDQDAEDEPAGPRALRFLDSDIFAFIAALVTLNNFLTICMELTHPGTNYGFLNDAFLVFYQVELVLNLIYKQRRYLFGDPKRVWWNWLDMFIVLCGTAELLLSSGSSSNVLWTSGLRTLRLLRLVRVMKIAKIILTSDMAWAEGPTFQTFMMCVISFNTVLMGLEEQWQSSFWPCIDYALLLIYIVELLVRLKHHRGKFFFGGACAELVWNWLDFVIVLGGVLDVWFVPSHVTADASTGRGAHSHHSISSLAQAMSVLRMVRLMRIIRLVRLVKGVPPLYTLVVGIAKAMQGVGWVMVLTVGVLYICSLVGVKLVGSGMVLPSNLSEHEFAEVTAAFEDIPKAFFVLFKAMNADLDEVEPLLNTLPISRFVMMLFIVLTNWAIFSILTAVVTENMAKVTSEHEAEMKEEREAQARARRADKLEFIYTRLDTEGNGYLDLEGFQKIMADEMQAEELTKVTGLQMVDLEDLFELLSKRHGDDMVETVTHKEFITLLNRDCGQVTARSMIKIERALAAIQKGLNLSSA